MKPQVWLKDAFKYLSHKTSQQLKMCSSSKQAAKALHGHVCALQMYAGEKQLRKSRPQGVPPRKQNESHQTLGKELSPLPEVFTAPPPGIPVRHGIKLLTVLHPSLFKWEFLLWPSYPCSTAVHWACLEVLNQGTFYPPEDMWQHLETVFGVTTVCVWGATTGISG